MSNVDILIEHEVWLYVSFYVINHEQSQYLTSDFTSWVVYMVALCKNILRQ